MQATGFVMIVGRTTLPRDRSATSAESPSALLSKASILECLRLKNVHAATFQMLSSEQSCSLANMHRAPVLPVQSNLHKLMPAIEGIFCVALDVSTCLCRPYKAARGADDRFPRAADDRSRSPRRVEERFPQIDPKSGDDWFNNKN